MHDRRFLCVLWFSHRLGHPNWPCCIKSDWRRLKSVYAALLVCVATAIVSPAQTFKTVATFNGFNGAEPGNGLVQGLDGSLLGTTPFGGEYGYGVVFKVSGFNASSESTLTALHSFSGTSTDGAIPSGGLVQTRDGLFYGGTLEGGANPCNYLTCGTIFQINSTGKFKILYSFCPQPGCPDGAFPESTLLPGADGNFYGTTTRFVADNTGVVFKFSRRTGTVTTLYSFCPQDTNCPEGNFPQYGVVQAADGTLYGTTTQGGNYDGVCAPQGCGTIFRLALDGKLTVLHTFAGAPSDGSDILSGLVMGRDGNLYGTTVWGGSGNPQQCQHGCGTVFKITHQGKLTILHNFCTAITTNCPDGSEPWGGLVEATDGNLYGVTSLGGAHNLGTIFKITPRGKLTRLYSFCAQKDCADGGDPAGTVIQGTDGNLYGTTQVGGDLNCSFSGCGTVFSLSLGLRPFVKTLPTSGEAGMRVAILGTNLIGVTSVKFNGVPAKFEVVSKSQLTTWVPEEAGTGKVEVKTSDGMLRSNVDFIVRP